MIQFVLKFSLLVSLSLSFAQEPASNPQAAQINALKQELESLRKKRDQVIAQRWSARELSLIHI